MKKLFLIHIAILIAMFALLTPLVQAQNSTGSANFDDAVAAYRSGQYQQAAEQLSQLCQEQPQSALYQYYYAISLARTGQYSIAREAYQAAINLAPNSQIAEQAQKGLSYLPAGENGLDAPPEPGQAGANASNATANNAMGNDKMMQMMLMMSMMGGGKGNNNMMMMPMMQQMMSGKPAQPGDENYISPEVMSQMMQQSMYEDMSPLFESGKDK